MKLHRHVTLAVLLASASIAFAAEDGAPHRALAEAISPLELVDRLTDRYLDAIFGEMRADTELVELEADCPGLFATGRAALRETLRETQLTRVDAYRSTVTSLLESEMSAAEAEEALAFYRSEYVSSRLDRVAESFEAHESAKLIVRGENESVIAEASEAEVERAIEQNRLFDGPGGSEMHRKVSQRPWFRTLLRLQPRTAALREREVHRVLSPEEEARMDQTLETAVYRHVMAC